MPPNFFVCKDEKDLGRLAREISISREFAFDVETNSLYWPTGNLHCISFWVNNAAYLVNFNHVLLPKFSYDQVKNALGQYFTDDDYKKYGFNLKFDAHWIERFLNIKVGYLHFDGYMASWLMETDLQKRGLKTLCELYLNDKSPTFEQRFGKTDWTVIDPRVATYYACHDAELHYKLDKFFEQELEKYKPHKKLFYELDMPVYNQDFEAEREGLRVDEEYLSKELSVRLSKELDELVQKAREAGLPATVDIGSTDQLASYLFDELSLPRIKGNSTDKIVLESLQDRNPVIPIISEWRETSKLKTGFVDTYESIAYKSRIYFSVKTTGTVTARAAMENPNLQQVPAKIGPMIRQVFIADPGFFLVSKDLKGQELRILAHFCGKGKLADVSVKGTIYEECAASFYKVSPDSLKKGDERRDNGKKAWLAMQYGAQGAKVASIFGCEKDEADHFIKVLFNERFPEIGRFQKNAISFSKKNGYIVGILGRKRHLHYDKAESWGQRMALERYAINTPIQQTAGEQIKLAFLLCNRWFKSKSMKSRAILRIHDEIIFHIAQEEWSDEMDKTLDSIITTCIPMDVEFETTTEIYPIINGVSKWGIKAA